MTWPAVTLGKLLAGLVLLVAVVILLFVALSVGAAIPDWVVYLLIACLAVAHLTK